MVQVYFLLVLTNILGGIILAKQGLKKSLVDHWEAFFQVLEGRYFRGILGLVTFVTGFLGLIFVLPGDQIFLGDLIPSLTALFTGTTLILGFYHKEDFQAKNTVDHLEDVLLKNKMILGLLSVAFGFIHFLSPTVIFL